MINKKEKIFEVTHYWNSIIKEIADFFRMNEKEIELLRRSKIAKVIGTIPYIAKCDNAERISINNLSIYIVSTKQPKSFKHSQRDDINIFERLSLINNFNSGDDNILLKGISLLALNMIHDYKRDMKEDLANNKYNPLNAGVWKYEIITSELINNINKVVSYELDAILRYEETKFMYWNYI